MKIKCVATFRKDLLNKAQEVYFMTHDFQLPIGKVLMCMVFQFGKVFCITLIVVDDDRKPDWYPGDLFNVEDTILPKEMHHMYFGAQDKRGVYALWSYKEMVVDYRHYSELIEREEKAIETFLKRKKDIDSI